MNKKTLLILCIAAAIVLGCFLGLKAYRSQKDRAYLREQYNALYDTITSASEELGLTDLEIASIEQAIDSKGNKNWYVSHASSESFAALTPEQMIDYFTSVADRADPSVKPYIACTGDAGEEHGGLRITSGGHEYMYRFHYKTWYLYRDGEIVWDSSAQKGSGKDTGHLTIEIDCIKCGGDGTTHDSKGGYTCLICKGSGKKKLILG